MSTSDVHSPLARVCNRPQVGQRYGLPLLSPVDDRGVFTAEAGPEFAGKAVQVGQARIGVGWEGFRKVGWADFVGQALLLGRALSYGV
eukprot:1157692-Pelagomonas_calceolata.AAC.7